MGKENGTVGAKLQKNFNPQAAIDDQKLATPDVRVSQQLAGGQN